MEVEFITRESTRCLSTKRQQESLEGISGCVFCCAERQPQSLKVMSCWLCYLFGPELLLTVNTAAITAEAMGGWTAADRRSGACSEQNPDQPPELGKSEAQPFASPLSCKFPQSRTTRVVSGQKTTSIWTAEFSKSTHSAPGGWRPLHYKRAAPLPRTSSRSPS